MYQRSHAINFFNRVEMGVKIFLTAR